MITIQIQDQGVRALVQRATSPAQETALLRVLGRELRNQLRTHYLHLQKTKPNRLGGRRQNFWRSVAHSVQNPELQGAHAVAVSIAHPAIRQKVEGGTITAKKAKALTIPVSKEAYGRTAETLEHELGIKLFVVPRDFGNGLLAAAMKDGRIQVHYVLRKRVDQQPDPEALPARSVLVEALTSRGKAWLDRTLAGHGNPGIS